MLSLVIIGCPTLLVIYALTEVVDQVPYVTADARGLMQLLIRSLDGSVRAAILMAIRGGLLRVAIPGCDDAVGFRWTHGHWLAENGDAVDIQFDVAMGEFCGRVRDAACLEPLCQRLLGPRTAHGQYAAPAASVN